MTLLEQGLWPHSRLPENPRFPAQFAGREGTFGKMEKTLRDLRGEYPVAALTRPPFALA
ncbi:MAG: hypothetical protein AB1591_05175 [Pseudomonadota bacterium]